MLQPTSLQGAQLVGQFFNKIKHWAPIVHPIQPEDTWRFTPLCRESEHRGLERTINKIASLT